MMFAPQHAPQPAGYAAATTPFSPHEHALFVEGVEVFCNNNNGSTAGESAWRHIAAHVRTRTPEEIKAHAQYYLMSLQSRNPEITRGRRVPALRPKLRAAPFRASGPRSRARADRRLASTAGTWTPAWSTAENAAFENALATYEEGDADRWTKIAALLPAKSAADVQQWYERLLGDLLEIERGAR